MNFVRIGTTVINLDKITEIGEFATYVTVHFDGDLATTFTGAEKELLLQWIVMQPRMEDVVHSHVKRGANTHGNDCHECGNKTDDLCYRDPRQ